MSVSLPIILEDDDGVQLETSCARVAVVWQGKEVWIQAIEDGQLMIGVDVDESDQEYTNVVVRPLATNLLSLALETVSVVQDDN